MHVLIASQHSVVREGLVRLLNKDSGLTAKGATVEEVPPEDEQPDVVLYLVEKQDLLTTSLEKVKATFPSVPIVVFLLTDDEETALRAVRSGVQGVVHYTVTPTELEECILQVMAGEFAISFQVARGLATHYQAGDNGARPSFDTSELTRREVEVLGFLADGATNREIAARLVLSEHTVRAHLRGVMQKLHVSNRGQAAALAWQGRLLQRADGKGKQ